MLEEGWRKKRRWRKAPWAETSSSPCSPAPVAHGPDGVRSGLDGLPSSVAFAAHGCRSPPSFDPSFSWTGGCRGISPLDQTLIPAARTLLPAKTSAASPSQSRLGFAPDFVGSDSFPHCASFLSRLWSLPVSSRSDFHGGWCVTSFRPPVPEEEWPRLGSGFARDIKNLGLMDSKNKNIPNPSWDRWGQKDSGQGSQSWTQNRNLSWRLKPQMGKADPHEGLMSSSSGDGTQSGNPILSPTSLKKEIDFARPAFCQKCGVDGHHAINCFNTLWCDICRKDTHVTARCVLPKQRKPNMPIVGMAADGLGFYLSHFAKPISKKPKRVFIGLVKVIEGLVSAEDLV
jgi:hypothetical protein